MGFLKLGKMTLKGVFAKPETRLYPTQVRQPFERTKGTIACDIEACIFCGACLRACPTFAIQVSKADRTWAIDPYDCIQCSNCVGSCPKKCIYMRGEKPNASPRKQIYLYHQHPYSEEEKARIAAEEAAKQEKIAKAKAAAAAKKKAQAEAGAAAQGQAAPQAEAKPAAAVKAQAAGACDAPEGPTSPE